MQTNLQEKNTLITFWPFYKVKKMRLSQRHQKDKKETKLFSMNLQKMNAKNFQTL